MSREAVLRRRKKNGGVNECRRAGVYLPQIRARARDELLARVSCVLAAAAAPPPPPHCTPGHSYLPVSSLRRSFHNSSSNKYTSQACISNDWPLACFFEESRYYKIIHLGTHLVISSLASRHACLHCASPCHTPSPLHFCTLCNRC